jgi:hypothetical protein
MFMICSTMSWVQPLRLTMIVNTLLFTAIVTLLMAVVTAAPIAVWLVCLRVWHRLRSRMALAVTGNRVLYWPLALAIVWPLLFALLLQLYQLFPLPVISEYFFIIIGLGLAAIWVGSIIVACRLMIRWVVARQWRTVLSTLILPLTFLLALSSLPMLAPFLWKETETAAGYAWFFMAYYSYMAQVEKEPANEPRFVVWMRDYSDGGLLYDETDQVASNHPSEAWKKKAELYGVVRSSQQHVFGHFYSVRLRQP